MLVSCPPAAAADLAAALVHARLAACVQASPVRSTYRWQGAVEADDEVLLTIKTAADRLDALRAHVLANHPYEVPEIVVLAADAASSHGPYVDWVVAETR